MHSDKGFLMTHGTARRYCETEWLIHFPGKNNRNRCRRPSRPAAFRALACGCRILCEVAIGTRVFYHDAAWRRVYIVFKVLAGRQQKHVPLAEDRIADKNL